MTGGSRLAKTPLETPNATLQEPTLNSSRQRRVISAERGAASLESLTELWDYREVLWAFATRLVKIKYKQAAIGIGRSILRPRCLALFTVFHAWAD
jgi:hypothetical protein